MKKILALLLALWIPAAVLSGCVPQDDSAASNKLNIVTTIFPAYDWVREILGDETDRAEITMLLDSGVDLHSYQPTVDDIVKISECDLFLYVGSESDGWVDDALKNAPNKDWKVIRLLDVLGDSAKAEETVEGMQEEEHDHEEEGHGHEEEAEYDEHIWLSLKNAQMLVAAISEALQESDPARKDTYAANAAAYAEKLSALDGEYRFAYLRLWTAGSTKPFSSATASPSAIWRMTTGSTTMPPSRAALPKQRPALRPSPSLPGRWTRWGCPAC